MKIFIGTPAYGCYVTKDWLSSMIMLRAACAKNKIETFIKMVGNESLITRARNLIVSDFLDVKDATHLLFIDADIKFNAHDVIYMAESGLDVVCGVYAKKSFHWDKVRSNPYEPVQQSLLDFNLNVSGKPNVIDNRYIEVLDAATGFMMIKREVIEKMYTHYTDLECINDVDKSNKKYKAIFDCMIDPKTKRYLSEDYAFCRRWQSIGGKVFIDLNCTLGHIGNYTYDPNNKKLIVPYMN